MALDELSRNGPVCFSRVGQVAGEVGARSAQQLEQLGTQDEQFIEVVRIEPVVGDGCGELAVDMTKRVSELIVDRLVGERCRKRFVDEVAEVVGSPGIQLGIEGCIGVACEVVVQTGAEAGPSAHDVGGRGAKVVSVCVERLRRDLWAGQVAVAQRRREMRGVDRWTSLRAQCGDCVVALGAVVVAFDADRHLRWAVVGESHDLFGLEEALEREVAYE